MFAIFFVIIHLKTEIRNILTLFYGSKILLDIINC